MPRLDLYINYELQATIKLDKPEVRIGRSPDCEVQLPDDRVSRVHAVIRPTSDGHEVEDRSANGVRVNGEDIVERQALRAGDAIFISSYILIYQPDEVPPVSLASTVHV